MLDLNGQIGRVLLTVFAAFAVGHGCDGEEGVAEGHFACGNGSCEIGTQLCVVDTVDGCTSCLDLPAPCEDDQACGCLDTVDTTTWDYPCGADPVCEDVGEGLVVECPADGWGCG